MSCVTLVIFTVLRVSTIPKLSPSSPASPLLQPSCHSLTPFCHQLSASVPLLASPFQLANFFCLLVWGWVGVLFFSPLSLYFPIHPPTLTLLLFDLKFFPAPTFSHQGKRAEPGVISIKCHSLTEPAGRQWSHKATGGNNNPQLQAFCMKMCSWLVASGNWETIVCRKVPRRRRRLFVLIDMAMKFDAVNVLLKTSWKIHSQLVTHKGISD